MRLDHFIAKKGQLSQRESRLRIARGEVVLNRSVERNGQAPVSRFCEVRLGSKILQASTERLYLMLNKPVGILSATVDDEHTTVLDLIDLPGKESLHLAGRLDRSSSGLMLLTNDGSWSDRLTQPESKTGKLYRVETEQPIPERAVAAFAEGFYFETEDITTQPAQLEILDPHRARVTIYEGRYHQIKRMFHRIEGIRLKSLHRERIGNLALPVDLNVGEWRHLTPQEVSEPG